MTLNYIHVSVTEIILRRGQQYTMAFSVAVVAGAIKLHKGFSDCRNLTSMTAVVNVLLCSIGRRWH